jgi:hypothetical protein
VTTRAAMVGSVLAAPLRWVLPSLLLSTCCGGAGQHDDKQTCTDGEGHQCLAIEATGAAAFAVLKQRLLERNVARGLERIQLAATARGRGLVAARHIRKGEEIFTVKLHAAIDCGEAVSASRSPSDLPIKVSGYPLALRAMRSGNYTEYALLCPCGQAPAGRPHHATQVRVLTRHDATRGCGAGTWLSCHASRTSACCSSAGQDRSGSSCRTSRCRRWVTSGLRGCVRSYASSSGTTPNSQT